MSERRSYHDAIGNPGSLADRQAQRIIAEQTELALEQVLEIQRRRFAPT